MANELTKKFISWLKSQVGSIYVWGGQGETAISEKWIKTMETSVENAERAIAFWKKRLEAGAKNLAAYDCSGLITVFLLEHGIIHSDMTSRGLYAICNQIERTALEVGDLVFRHNGENIYHVGVYIGNDKVIHARGRDYGVVEETLDQNGVSYWNRCGRLSCFSEKTAPAAKEDRYPKAMEYTGATYVNLRSTPDCVTDDNVTGRVSHGDIVLVLGETKDTWREVIVRDGKGFRRGYCIGSWLKDIDGDRF